MKVHFNSKKLSGNSGFVSWDRMEPYLRDAIRLDPSETIEAVNVTEDGLTVKIGPSKGKG